MESHLCPRSFWGFSSESSWAAARLLDRKCLLPWEQALPPSLPLLLSFWRRLFCRGIRWFIRLLLLPGVFVVRLVQSAPDEAGGGALIQARRFLLVRDLLDSVHVRADSLLRNRTSIRINGKIMRPQRKAGKRRETQTSSCLMPCSLGLTPRVTRYTEDRSEEMTGVKHGSRVTIKLVSVVKSFPVTFESRLNSYS